MTRDKPRPADIARDARRVTVTGLLDRLTRRAKLTDAELLLLRAQWEIETTEAELAEKARRGLDRQRDQMIARLQAAEDTIREVEADRDDWADRHRRLGIELEHWQTVIVPELKANRQCGERPPQTVWLVGSRCIMPAGHTEPHADGTGLRWLPPLLPSAAVERLRGETGQPICTCTWAGLDTTRLCPRHDDPTAATKES